MGYFTIQSMKRAHWPCVFAAAFFIGWTHAHTDEVPVVLGFVLLLARVTTGGER